MIKISHHHILTTTALVGLVAFCACSSRSPSPFHRGESADATGGDGAFGTLVVSGPNGPSEITYEVVDGHAYVGGDIELGPIDELHSVEKNVGRTSPSSRWPGKLIPFTMDASLSPSKRDQIEDAMDHWTTMAGFTFIERTSETQYVRFADENNCSSPVGMGGGVNIVRVARTNGSGADTCPTGSIIHEIGHTVGLGHTHQQCNRDNFLIYTWNDPDDPNEQANFGKLCGLGWADYSWWDTQSIMHYGSSANLTLLDGSGFTAQRLSLSDGDLQAVREMYDYLLRPPLIALVL